MLMFSLFAVPTISGHIERDIEGSNRGGHIEGSLRGPHRVAGGGAFVAAMGRYARRAGTLPYGPPMKLIWTPYGPTMDPV